MSIGAIALFYGFQLTPPVSSILILIKSMLPMQLDRFYFLYTMFWMLVFALVLSTLRHHAPSLRFVIILVVVLQSAYAFRHHEVIANRNKRSNFFIRKELYNFNKKLLQVEKICTETLCRFY